MKFYKLIIVLVMFSNYLSAQDTIFLSKGIKSLSLNLNEESFILQRNQSKDHKISSLYVSTYRGIPQSMIIEAGIETLGELELIEYLKKASKDESIILVDSRTNDWYENLRIPGSINVPFTNFNQKEIAIDTLESEFDVEINDDGSLDFTNAKTLLIYCNGYWCGQSPAMIKYSKYSLLKLKYPKEKIKYYRGGMQAWTSLGLTTKGIKK